MTSGKELKDRWMQRPEEHFQTLTFADLETGDYFISLPQPGNGNKIDSFRKDHPLYFKTTHRTAMVLSNRLELLSAINDRIPANKPVIRIRPF